MAVTSHHIRTPNVSGSFYESHPMTLKKTIDAFFQNCVPIPTTFGEKPVRAIIAPHAGYSYCGRVMASVYQTLRHFSYDRVILIGPSHSVGFHSIAFDTASAWQTPLGDIPIDSKTNEQFFFHEEFDVLPRVFDKEHSLEVQLAFLQASIPTFSLVPLCTGQNLPHEAIAQIISSLLTKTTVVVISSDFSHYHTLDEAKKIDTQSIQAILSNQPDHIDQTVDACGVEGINILAHIAIMQKWKPYLIDYQTSGDVTGDTHAVVGYAGMMYV